ncbi:MAG TPA: hypothetical protein VGT61_10685 [Thermomicrobiales bacterium]|jgi:hypothetical protein|nr:hypothetical protein [Thermomicrobiales bacterium]
MTTEQTRDEHRMTSDRLWVPDNPDGSGWADVDWVSAAQGSRYHYQHGPELAQAEAERPAFYRVRTRLESADLTPHENDYYVAAPDLAEFVTEVVLAGGAEIIWHIEPCPDPPAEARLPS